MTDFNTPQVTTQYASFLAALSGRINDVLLGADPNTTSVTNQPVNAIRWNSTTARWEKWNGTTWAVLTATYAIAISGNAATASVASAVAWAAITGKPTTIAGFGISDAAPLASPQFTGTPLSSGVEVGFRDLVSLASAATAVAGPPTTGSQGKIYKQTGNITFPASTFSGDDCVCVYNATNAAISIIQGAGLTMRLGGTLTVGTRSLAARGIATVWFVSPTECVVSGNVS